MVVDVLLVVVDVLLVVVVVVPPVGPVEVPSPLRRQLLTLTRAAGQVTFCQVTFGLSAPWNQSVTQHVSSGLGYFWE